MCTCDTLRISVAKNIKFHKEKDGNKNSKTAELNFTMMYWNDQSNIKFKITDLGKLINKSEIVSKILQIISGYWSGDDCCCSGGGGGCGHSCGAML